jgi:hypothetical protein
MSAYAARLKSEMKPMLDELRELNELESPTDEQKSDIDRIAAALAQKNDEHKKAIERHQKMLGASSMFDSLNEPEPQPRAVYERPSTGNGAAETGEVKSISTYLTDSRQFKAARSNDHYQVEEKMPVAAVYPFLETKAPFIPGNLGAASGNLRVISPSTVAAHALLDLLRTVPYNDLVVPYLPLTFTNNATEQAYGQPKVESTNAGTIATVMMTTIAHWKEVPRQILRYIPGLRPIVDDELREGVLRRVGNRVLNGTGTGTPPQMLGILPQVTQTATGANLMAQIFSAIGIVESNGGMVDAIVMNPADYAGLLAGEYAANKFNPLLASERFGQFRIVRDAAMTAGTALVGDFGQAVTLFVGESANVRATEALGFKSNIVTVLCEMDSVVLVERPWLLCKATGPLTF